MSQQNINQDNSNAHITFIGGGNMGRALISGLLANGFEPNQISVVKRMRLPLSSFMKILAFKVSALSNK